MVEISVIVPVYRAEAYLHRCVDSILSQTFEGFELILVDDGSPDSCGKICDEYAKKDDRVRVIHKQNGGVCTARNSGLEAASGRFITFCDSDDYFGPDRLRTMLLAFENPDVDMVSTCLTRVFEDSGATNRTHRITGLYRTEPEREKCDFMIGSVLMGELGWEACCKMFRADIIKKNGLRFCETCDNFAEDLEFVLEYLLFCSAVYCCDSCDYYYSQHDASMMSGSKARPKLNAVNEVSKCFSKRFFAVIERKDCRELFPVIHYLIMNNQYNVVRANGLLPSLRSYIDEIKDRAWFEASSRAGLRSKESFKKYLGDQDASLALNTTHYCLDNNRVLFALRNRASRLKRRFRRSVCRK